MDHTGGFRTDAAVGGHFRDRIEKLESRLQERAKFLAKREAQLKASEARVDRLGTMCYETAETLAKSTPWPILIQHHRNIGPLQFQIRAGTSFTLVARLTQDGWHVVSRLKREIRTATFTTDAEFADAHPALLEALLGDALEAVVTGRDVLLSPVRQEKRSPFWVRWQKMFSTLSAQRGERSA